MVLGGFSGRGTRSLAEFVRTRSNELWPPIYDTDEQAIGAFFLRFEYERPGGREASAPPHFQKPKDSHITPLAREAIERRLVAPAAKQRKGKD
jgi:hypothetical protein